MKPAVCCICGKASAFIDDGDWIEFRDCDSERTPQLSHPVGLEYFCNQHIEEARRFINMSSVDALYKLNAIYPCNDIN